MTMPTLKKSAIFIDTNIAMHFLRIDQLDWFQISGVPQVEIVICSVFLRELEKHKVEHSSKKLRKRAGEYSNWLARKFDETFISENVKLRFLLNEPQIDYMLNGLDPNIADDRLVASVLELINADRDLTVAVITADIGLTLKLRTRGISVYAPPEIARLAEEPTEEELEIRELRKQLSKYANRRPSPLVTFSDGEQFLKIERRKIIEQPSFIQSKMEVARKKFPKAGPQDLPNLEGSPLAVQIGTSIRSMLTSFDKMYNTDIDRYLFEYERYLEELYSYGLRSEAMKRLDLQLSNLDGTAPATKIDIFLTCEGSAVLSEVSTKCATPTAPEQPRKPELFGSGAALPVFHNPVRIRTIDDALKDADPTRHRLLIDAGKACFYIHQVKHRQFQNLLPIWLDYENVEKLSGVTLTYEIHADEIADPISGTLHIKV